MRDGRHRVVLAKENKMKENIRLIIVVIATLSISACAHFTHYNTKSSIDGHSAIFVDAKQRGVYSYTKKTAQANEIFRGFCAEPSPDAVSAMAATLGLDLTLTDKGKLGFSSALSEGVANIGLRTAAIQALRDIMYRNCCEAYGLGGITPFGLL